MLSMLNISLILIIFFVLIINVFEKFGLGIGTGFGQYIPPQQCTPENDCYKGAYFRTQSYQNVCPPDYGQLDRTKVQLQDGCLRNLGKYPAPKYKLHCSIDDRLNRQCNWYKNDDTNFF